MRRRPDRGLGAGVLVAGIASAFGVVLLAAAGYLGAALRTDPAVGDSSQLATVITMLSVILVGVATYVAGVVTANTVATVVAGRARSIALLRLLGASAAAQRAAVTREGRTVGLVGAVVGSAAGLGVAALLRVAADARSDRSIPFDLLAPRLLLPGAAVLLTTWGAARVGSRRVLEVTPLQALSAAQERPAGELRRRPVRHGAAALLVGAGIVLITLGLLVGLRSPAGVLVAFAGGVLSFTGVAVGATLVVPPVLRLVGRVLGRSVPARLAAEQALQHPERASRTAIGVVIGVTLVTTFAVASESAKQVIAAGLGGTLPPDLDDALTTFSTVMSTVVAVAAVIAAVGLVNLLTLGVVARRRELGLLRTLGLSAAQVRRMVLLEAAHVAVTAVLLGLALGVAYGWAGAQATFGSLHLRGDPTAGHLVVPAIPWWPVGIIAAATAVLTLVAAVVPTRIATRVTPVAALAEA